MRAQPEKDGKIEAGHVQRKLHQTGLATRSVLRLKEAKPPRRLPGWLLLPIAIVVLCAANGCGGDSAALPTQNSQGCPEQPDGEEAVQTLKGDVTGDGRLDTVSLAVAPKERPRCRYRLVLDSQQAKQALVLHQSGLERSFWPESDLPRIEGLAAIDEQGGEEIVVAVGGGAAITAIALVTFFDGRLHRMSIESTMGQSKDTLTYGASGGGAAVVDCVGGAKAGRVSELSMSRAAVGMGWTRLARKLFRVADHRLELEQAEDERKPASDPAELAERAFPSC